MNNKTGQVINRKINVNLFFSMFIKNKYKIIEKRNNNNNIWLNWIVTNTDCENVM